MPGDALPRKWRAAADGVSAALGLNVWVSLVFVPGMFVGTFRGSSLAVALASIPPVVLGTAVALWPFRARAPVPRTAPLSHSSGGLEVIAARVEAGHD